MRGLSLVVASGGHSSSRCAGLSLSWPLVAEHRLQTCRLSNCGSRAQLLRGTWDLPRPGLKPMSPALAGRFSTTALPVKPGNTESYPLDHQGIPESVDFQSYHRVGERALGIGQVKNAIELSVLVSHFLA